MKKTTIYLPDELLAAIKNVANHQQCSEASLIRSALEKEFDANLNFELPNFNLFGDADIKWPNWDLSNLDEAMVGFGSK